MCLGCRVQIVDAVRSHQVILLAGETGCGKTTQVPQYILEDSWGAGSHSAHAGNSNTPSVLVYSCVLNLLQNVESVLQCLVLRCSLYCVHHEGGCLFHSAC